MTQHKVAAMTRRVDIVSRYVIRRMLRRDRSKCPPRHVFDAALEVANTVDVDALETVLDYLRGVQTPVRISIAVLYLERVLEWTSEQRQMLKGAA